MRDQSEYTRLLVDLSESDNKTADELFPLIYNELKKIAGLKLQKESNDITLTKTALVHEVYLKMIDQTKIQASDKNHFLAIAARCMRQILVDHARKKKAEKRGGDKQDVTYIDELLNAWQASEKVIDLDNKLQEMAEFDQRMADVVTLRFFGQMSSYAIADVLGISKRTVTRDWAKARGWLHKELKHKF